MSKSYISIFNELENSVKTNCNSIFQEYLVNPYISLIILAEQFNEITGLSIDRKKVSELMKKLGYVRSPEIIKQSRILLGKQGIKAARQEKTSFSDDELIKIYQDQNLSLQKMYEKYGVAPVTLSRLAKERGIDVATQRTIIELLKTLETKHITEDMIKNKYIVDNVTSTKMIEWLNIVLDGDDNVTNKTFENIVKHLDIYKTDKQIIETRGAQSRATLVENIKKLRKAGFDSSDSLAKYYEDNKNITCQMLIRELNSKIDSDDVPFTTRWIERHMYPLLSVGRLYGVSRGELALLTFVESIYSGTIVSNNRQLIAPYEVDIYLPEINLAIEFNGDYWHSDKFLVPNHGKSSHDYHSHKLSKGLDKGVNVIFVWESDWEFNTDSIKADIIDAILNGNINDSLLKLSSV